MIVDRRKDSYDELMMLSRDSRLERNRKSLWTHIAVAGAVVASGIYIGGTNQHLGDLAEAKNAAENQRNNLRQEFSRALLQWPRKTQNARKTAQPIVRSTNRDESSVIRTRRSSPSSPISEPDPPPCGPSRTPSSFDYLRSPSSPMSVL